MWYWILFLPKAKFLSELSQQWPINGKGLWSTLVTQTELCSVHFLLSARNGQLSCPDNTQVLLFRNRRLHSSQELLSLPFIKWEGFSLSLSILKFTQDSSCKCQLLDKKSTYLLWSQKQLIFYIGLGISRKLWFLFDWTVSQLVNSVYICKLFGISSNLFWSWQCVHEKYQWQNSEIMYWGFQTSAFWVMGGVWLDVPFWVALSVVQLTPLASCPTSWSSGHLLMCLFDLANVKKKSWTNSLSKYCQKQPLTLGYSAGECRIGNISICLGKLLFRHWSTGSWNLPTNFLLSP